ncbi:hypothetical protein [Caenimonas aquaedulcis]|uniref:DUF4214 domain-containing protein n=1 Tax=Caenimonas aquaedulcis TaxID=2793270 RepID=A0A931H891_9BURK|nr:hypothetical protein [Caenimonas aquaedulcis]MBG9390534.1 hypothetical protein [Caenimonas aquaedulcis]
MSTPTFFAGEATLVNSTTEGFQELHHLFATPDGGYEVAWSTTSGTPGNLSTQWFAQRYDGAGVKVGGESAIAGPPDAPALSAGQDEVFLSDGSSVRLNGESFGAFTAQLYDSSGQPVGEPLLMKGAARGWTYAGTLLPDGNVALVFQPVNGTGPGEIFTALLDKTSPPAGAVFGASGDDQLGGTGSLDTAVIAAPLSSVHAHSFADGSFTLASGAGTDTLTGIERVQLSDALFALDTRGPDGHAWQAAALLHAGLGALPGIHELSMWTSQADLTSGMGALAQKMIDFYAPGVSTAALVTQVYGQLVHTAPGAETVQTYVDQVGAGRTFETQGDLLAFAANLSLNTDAMVGFTGSVQALDPAFF